jgi:hypothetical protein
MVCSSHALSRGRSTAATWAGSTWRSCSTPTTGKGFLQMLQAEGEQGQQQPCAEPEQGGGIVISGGQLYAC